MLYTICIALILVASVLVILAVLVQNPKSGMAANFGASNQVMGVRETTNFLEKFTWESIFQNSLSHLTHKLKQEVEIMVCYETQCQNFFRLIQVTNISAGIIFTCIALTTFF